MTGFIYRTNACMSGLAFIFKPDKSPKYRTVRLNTGQLATLPVAYLLNASDLRPIDQNNKIFKYADDTYLIVCDSNAHTIPKELQHISEWATRHNLKSNQAKSKEIVLSLHKTPVSAATFLTRVKSLTVLGITFNSKLRLSLISPTSPIQLLDAFMA